VTELATLASGCFWCVEAVFNRLRGVTKVVSGYLGGLTANPTYQEVSRGSTGHAEAVQLEFDPEVISYRELLEIFFAFHDPTTENRQGADIGTQYRSAIFTHTADQERIAGEVIAELEAARVFPDPIVTEVAPAGTFYPAEPYHQDYYAKNPTKGYCVAVIGPKVGKLRQKYADRLKN
jgi:peptide-methionine (S)-S-oxide reductase